MTSDHGAAEGVCAEAVLLPTKMIGSSNFVSILMVMSAEWPMNVSIMSIHMYEIHTIVICIFCCKCLVFLARVAI